MQAWNVACVVLAASVLAAFAADSPVIAIHPIVDCATIPGGIPLADPGAQGGCLGPEIIVQDRDFVGATHRQTRAGADVLALSLSEDARRRLYAFTREHLLKSVAILVDGRFVSAEVVIEPILSTSIEIPGLSASEIDALVERLRAPAGGI